MSLNLITYIKEKTLMKDKILVVEIKPGEHPKTSYLGTSLDVLQNAVGGYIELLTLGDGCHILYNEEGKLRGLEPNRIYGDEVIVGVMYITRVDDEGFFVSLTDEDVDFYMNLFYEPLLKGMCYSTFKTSKHTDAFFINEVNNTVEWVYFNPDGNNGRGQFVSNLFTFNDVLDAAEKHKDENSFFDYLGSVAKQTLADRGTKEYVEYYAYFYSAVDLTDCSMGTMQALIDEAKENMNSEMMEVV